MRRLKRPAVLTLVAAGCALLVGFLYVSPVLKEAVRLGLGYPLRLNHLEGTSLTTLGKWWVLPPHRYLSDGSSGEFPVYSYYLSDALLNLIAALGGWSAMAVQAVVYGPLLGAAFLLLNYLSVAAVTRDRWVALGAALLISLGGSSIVMDRADPVSGFPLNFILHVPFHTISLGTAQSLGWVLFLPCLSLTHLARRSSTAWRPIANGVALGVLLQVHTLTFVNVAVVQVVYVILSNAVGRPRDRQYRIWLLALGVVAAGFVLLVTTRPLVPLSHFAALAVLALAATFAFDPHKRYYLWTYGAAALVASPYVVLLARHARVLAALQDAEVQRAAVGLAGLGLFFAGYLMAAGLAYVRYRERPVLVWASAILLATLFLAFNHLWHWGNHPYRFAINLIFPLGVLAALGVRHAPWRLSAVPGLWLGALCLLNVGRFSAGERTWVQFSVDEPDRAAFLKTVRQTTAPAERTGTRILVPPEVGYPRGVFQAALLLDFSRIPSFVPDYRRVLWRERYYNRMGLFCFLFPGYPNEDTQFARRACEEPLDPEPGVVEIRDPRLKTAILPLYSIGFAGAPAKPFSNYLKDASRSYGWPTIVETDRASFVRTTVAPLAGVARLVEGRSTPSTLSIRFEVDVGGRHVLVLGGRKLAERAPRILLDGRELGDGQRSANWAVFTTELTRGEHVLQLPSHDSGPDPESDYLYFVSLVHEDRLLDYLALGQVPRPTPPTGELRRLEIPPQYEAETVGVDETGERQEHGAPRDPRESSQGAGESLDGGMLGDCDHAPDEPESDEVPADQVATLERHDDVLGHERVEDQRRGCAGAQRPEPEEPSRLGLARQVDEQADEGHSGHERQQGQERHRRDRVQPPEAGPEAREEEEVRILQPEHRGHRRQDHLHPVTHRQHLAGLERQMGIRDEQGAEEGEHDQRSCSERAPAQDPRGGTLQATRDGGAQPGERHLQRGRRDEEGGERQR